MSYTKQIWTPNVTPVDAAHMNHIEDGIANALPTVVNGQWIKGVGGAAVWSAIKSGDVPGTIRLAGAVNSDGTIAQGTGFTSVHRSAGNYVITATNGLNTPFGVLLVTPIAQSVVAGGQQSQGNVWTVLLTTPGTWTDAAFYFAVFDMATFA